MPLHFALLAQQLEQIPLEFDPNRSDPHEIYVPRLEVPGHPGTFLTPPDVHHILTSASRMIKAAEEVVVIVAGSTYLPTQLLARMIPEGSGPGAMSQLNLDLVKRGILPVEQDVIVAELMSYQRNGIDPLSLLQYLAFKPIYFMHANRRRRGYAIKIDRELHIIDGTHRSLKARLQRHETMPMAVFDIRQFTSAEQDTIYASLEADRAVFRVWALNNKFYNGRNLQGQTMDVLTRQFEKDITPFLEKLGR